MNVEFLTGFIVTSTAWLVLTLFYRYAIQPVLDERARFRLLALRDEVRRLEVGSEQSLNSRRYLEMAANSATRSVSAINLLTFMEWVYAQRYDSRARSAVEDVKKARVAFLEGATEPTKELDRRISEAVFHSMLVNSPWCSLFAFLVYLFSKPLPEVWKSRRDSYIYRDMSITC